MHEIWRENIRKNHDIVRNNFGPELVAIVSGSIRDQVYWQSHLEQTKSDAFRSDGNTQIVSVLEKTRKGNFLGTFNAWLEMRRGVEETLAHVPDIALISMVFGDGKRLSPFTQRMGNRKSAFQTPMRTHDKRTYMNTADFSNVYANLWIQHLRSGGFKGILVKWGDEAIVPGLNWDNHVGDFTRFDAFRFVWKTQVTQALAKDKEWVVIDPEASSMVYQLTRQSYETMMPRIGEFERKGYQFGVNLGSLAISHDFLEIAVRELREDIVNPSVWIDWDPYAWLALCCRTELEWRKEIEYQIQIGNHGILKLDEQYPNFYAKINSLRRALEDRLRRPLRIGVVDFGEAFWDDLGLHASLRKSLENLTQDSEVGKVARQFYGLPAEVDGFGNLCIDSEVSSFAQIRNSVIIDSHITGKEVGLNNALVVGTDCENLLIPHGGSVLFCKVKNLILSGTRAIAYHSVGENVTLGEGSRHTTLRIDSKDVSLLANEDIEDLKERNYAEPILNNPLSFLAAAQLAAEIDSVWEATGR